MSCTLRIWRTDRVLHDPAPEEIRPILAGYQDDGPLLILSEEGTSRRLQVSGTARDGFAFDYWEGEGEDFLHSPSHNHSLDTAMQLLTGFMDDTADWQALVEWAPMSSGPGADGVLGLIFRLLGLRRA